MGNLSPLPLVAIIGRPNVGKSQLFNRLLGRRIALVHSEAGTTRDRIYGEIDWQGTRFQLVDTGGLISASTVLEKGMMKQLQDAVQPAELCLLAVDVLSGLHPADFEVAGYLRRLGKKVFVVINKVDNKNLLADASEFSRLGFQEMFSVSALHGLGIGELMETIARSLPRLESVSSPLRAVIAVVGRPNVGKSTLANRLLGEERVLVDSEPGTTRDAVTAAFTWNGRPYLLIDTAGSVRKLSSRSAVERYSLSRTRGGIARADLVLLLLEKFHPPTRADAAIIRQALEQGKGCLIAVNKWDIPGDVSLRQYRQQLRDLLPYAGFLPVVFFSALTGKDIDRLLQTCEYVLAQRERKIPTPVLNRVLQIAQKQTPIPASAGKKVKVLYAVQTGASPPVFRLFISHPRLLTAAGRGYLINQLRRALGFEGVPIKLDLRPARSSRNK